MNDAPACVFAGQMNEYAHGVPKNEAAAGGFYEKACDLGWAAGCYNLAILSEKGHGVPQDRPKAAKLYGIACRAGAKQACEKETELQAALSEPNEAASTSPDSIVSGRP
jgi:TPR repeat protein